DTRFEQVSQGTLVMSRTYLDELVFSVFNKTDEVQLLEIDIPVRFRESGFKSNFGGKLQQEGTKLLLELAPYSFEILTNSN
ncbi:MAG: hypothetical protein KDC34_17400, partial [Saprospiraceae bacterium]|nr:hypothetical protein [Saprospiraceae bacterium]